MPRMAVAAATSGDTRCVRPPLPCRPSKLRLRGGGAALPRRELVGVHPEAHRAAGEPPLGAELLEDLVDALGLGLEPHAGAAGHDHHADAVGLLLALDDRGEGAQVFDAAVGAGAHEHRVDLDVLHRGAGRRGPCTRARARRESRALRVGDRRRVGHGPAQRDALAGVGAPGDERLELVRVEEDLGVEDGVVVGGERVPVGDRVVPVGALRRVRPALRGRRRWSRRARPCRRGRPPRSTCCRWSSGPPWRGRGWRCRGTRARSPGRRRCRSSR